MTHFFSLDVVLLQNNVGLWAAWKGKVNFAIILLWLWAVDLWADLK
jgi:hypothetical protein